MKPRGRIDWVDTAKAIGMFLVYYGHVIQRPYPRTVTLDVEQLRFIYAFHIPFFFVLSGYVTRTEGLGLKTFVLPRIFSRITPHIFFNLLIMPFFFLFASNNFAADMKFVLHSFLLGRPNLNYLTWFLVCLLTVEVFHACFWRFGKNKACLLFSILAFFAAGTILNMNKELVVSVTHVSWNVWYVYDAFIAYSLFLTGILFRQSGVLEACKNKLFLAAVAVALFFLLYNTYGLQDFTNTWTVTAINNSYYGNHALFMVNALLGTIALVCLSQVIPSNRLIRFVGENTIAFLGLNGFIAWLLNPRIREYLLGIDYIYDSVTIFTLTTLIATMATMAICIPAALLLGRYLPICVGKYPYVRK